MSRAFLHVQKPTIHERTHKSQKPAGNKVRRREDSR